MLIVEGPSILWVYRFYLNSSLEQMSGFEVSAKVSQISRSTPSLVNANLVNVVFTKNTYYRKYENLKKASPTIEQFHSQARSLIQNPSCQIGRL